MPGRRPLRALVRALVVALVASCGAEKPPAPESGDAPPQAEGAAEGGSAASLPAEPDRCVLTFAGDRGAFQDTKKPADVPEEARGMVRVTLLDGPTPPTGKVWVANLRAPAADGSWPLTTVVRDDFEELAVGQGRSSKVDLPAGIEPPEAKPQTGEVIVYKTEWCGVCKKLTAYLDKKGVAYVAKDIEKDAEAAGELQRKSREKGLKTGSVPVIDVRGEMMVGFDRARLEKLL
ncbi:MAG: glutaredoxin domain-containing protein [Nannocystaceae bacterium]